MNIDLSKYDGVIFDMDGTLIDTMPAHLNAWEATAVRFGFPYDRNWIHNMGGKPSASIAEEVSHRYDITLDFDAVVEFKMRTFSECPDKGSIIEHTFEVLKTVYGDKKVAIGTGSQRGNAINLLEERNLVSYFDTIVTSSDVEQFKPFPDTFLLAAKNLGVTASACVVFEDTELGKRAAHAAGMDCIMVLQDGFTLCPLLRDHT